jgi:hypothetical protein
MRPDWKLSIQWLLAVADKVEAHILQVLRQHVRRAEHGIAGHLPRAREGALQAAGGEVASRI